jgi:two-component system response regulator FixJ
MPTPTPAAPDTRIVLIDDDSAVRSALSFSLELDGFAVETYGSTEILPETPLVQRGCLVLDYNLKGQDGLQLLACLRARRVDLPAVLIATNPDARLRRRAAAVSVAIVEKPILGDALVEGVRSALGLGPSAGHPPA